MTHQNFISKPRRALLIGINEYPNFDEQEQLKGCRNDVELARRTLLARGYDAGEISTLLDAEASREGIFDALEKLARFAESSASKGAPAEIFMHYSGHGSYCKKQRKSSGQSETLVPYDSGRRRSDRNLDISDEWIRLWLQEVRRSAGSVVLVIDSCHSGSMARNAFGVRRRLLPPSALPPEPPPPRWLGGRGLGGDGLERAGYVLASACRADQAACEIGARQGNPSSAYGAFSYYFYRNLRNAQDGAMWIDVFELARLQVTSAFPTQNPQLEGDRQKPISTGEPRLGDRYVLVSRRDGHEIRLDGGILHGLVEGSIWALYPPGTRVPETDQQTARAEVLEVESTTARARLLDGAPPDAILPGFRAFELRRPESHQRLKVFVQLEVAGVSAPQDLIAGLQSAPGVALTDSPDEADFRLLEQSCFSEPSTWQAWLPGDVPLGTAQNIDDPEGLSNLIANLVKWARYRQMLDLASQRPWMPCELQFLAETDEGWAEAETMLEGGDFSFEVGQRMAFKVSNLSREPIFPYLFHLSDQGEVHLLDPVRGGHEALAPGQSRTVGKGRRKLTATWTGGLEYIQLFNSLSEVDLSFLTQSGFRGLGGPDAVDTGSSGEASIATGLLGSIAARGMSIEEAETWGTLKRSFRVFKRH